jgi:predicted kinase
MLLMVSVDMLSSAETILRALPPIDQANAEPVLFVFSGLPGTGKSFLARRVAERVPCAIVETDFVRKTLIRQPTYAARESAFVHQVAQQVIRRLLEYGSRVIYDATNLAEWHRERAYRLAEQTRAKLVVVRTVAPEDVIRARLAERFTARHPLDYSEADWPVVELLRAELEPIRRPHIVVDTTGDIDQAVSQILRAAR